MQQFKSSISVKLTINLLLCLIFLFGVIGIMNFRMHKRHLMDGVIQNAAQISDIIKRSTNFSMLKNERERIYRIIQDIAEEPGIQKIRIYNKEGRTTFSTDPGEVDKTVNVHAEACVVCHSGPMPTGHVTVAERSRDYYSPDGSHVLGVISPIKSEISCITSDCHAHSEEFKVLGVLDVIMQLDKVDASLQEYEARLKWFVSLAIILVCFISILFVYVTVYRPVKKIVEGTKRIAEGDLDFEINIKSKDEIGGLAQSFNFMARELKSSQHQLLSAKAYTDDIIRSMSNSLVVINQNTIIQKVNKTTCDLLGYEEAELIGRPIAMIFAEGYFEEIGLDDLPIKNFNTSVETTYLAKTGEKIHVLFSGSTVRDQEGMFQGIVCMAQDNTWQTEAMHAGHLAALGELAAGVAHEINNPLNSIINFAQLTIDEIQRKDDISEDTLNMIIKEADRVSSIVRSLLSFAREQERTKSPIKIKDVLEETLALTETQLAKEGIILELDIDENLPAVMGDFQQIQQVFVNVVNNSRYALNAKFTSSNPEKILSIRLAVKVIDSQPFVEIAFRDNGTGIPSSIIEKVMDPFYSTKPAGQGTGLGLAISHGIITDHDGKITIESIKGEYTKISILLPVKAGAGELAA